MYHVRKESYVALLPVLSQAPGGVEGVPRLAPSTRRCGGCLSGTLHQKVWRVPVWHPQEVWKGRVECQAGTLHPHCCSNVGEGERESCKAR